MRIEMDDNISERILLAILPLWDKLIPPLGISCLKEFLTQKGFFVKVVDLNSEEELKEALDNYLTILKAHIPENKRSNFYNISHEVVHEHMMAHINYENEKKYFQLVKTIVFNTFYCNIEDGLIEKLAEILNHYYQRLEAHFFKILEEEAPSVLGLSVYSSTLPSSLFLFRKVKEKYPHIKTVMGGGVFTNQLALGSPNLEFFIEKTKNYIDKIIIGEGEILFLKYLKGEFPGFQRVYTLEDIKGEVLNFSEVEVPDYFDFDLKYYKYLGIYGARSCPQNCNFCSETVIWGKYRKKETSQIVRELKALHERHGFQLFLLCDSLVNSIITSLAEEMLKEDISIYLDGYLRAEKAVGDKENTMLWRKGGFYRARLGIESGSQKILDAMAKRITTEQIIEAVSSLAYAGIKTTTYWIVGYPGETEKDFQQTLDLIELLKDDIYEVDCNPFAFTLSGQVSSQKWKNEERPKLLYPEDAKDMLITQTWLLDCEPSREVSYSRLNRLMEHIRRLKIPNPYSVYDIYKADQRWKELHRNAVPSLVEFESENVYIKDTKDIKKILLVENLPEDKGDFNF